MLQLRPRILQEAREIDEGERNVSGSRLGGHPWPLVFVEGNKQDVAAVGDHVNPPFWTLDIVFLS